MARKGSRTGGPPKRDGHRAKPKGGALSPQEGGLPSKEQILAFINGAQGKVGKREIAKAFGIKGGERIALKRLLAELADEGTLSGNRKGLREKGQLPPVAALEVTGRDDDGDLICRPVVWNAAEDGERPSVLLLGTHGRDDPLMS